MGTYKINDTAKKLYIGFFAIMMLILLQSCATKVPFLTSSVVPAAQGEVIIKQNKNQNYVINMKISNLAQIDRLQPAKAGYIVWMEADRANTRNIGRITSSNNLNVTFETTSTLRPSRIFITAEDNENVQYPGPMVVLTTAIIGYK